MRHYEIAVYGSSGPKASKYRYDRTLHRFCKEAGGQVHRLEDWDVAN